MNVSLRTAPLMTSGLAFVGIGALLVTSPTLISPHAVAPAPARSVYSQNVALTATSYGIIGKVVELFVSNGTETHPNAGILAGNGYSYTAADDLYCQSHTCNGGNGGLLVGNGGNGWNSQTYGRAGGNGGNAGFLGLGNGGSGGNGVDAQYSTNGVTRLFAATAGGTGGNGGLFGNGGKGGNGGTDSGTDQATVDAVGGAAGAGGRGGWVWGDGAAGGNGGSASAKGLYNARGAEGGAGGRAILFGSAGAVLLRAMRVLTRRTRSTARPGRKRRCCRKWILCWRSWRV